jgi:integrase
MECEQNSKRNKNIEIEIDTLHKIDEVLYPLVTNKKLPVTIEEDRLRKYIKKMKILNENEADNITQRVLCSFIKYLNEHDVLDCKIPSIPKKEVRELSFKFSEDAVQERNKYLKINKEFARRYPAAEIYEQDDYYNELCCAFAFAIVTQSFATFPNFVKSLRVVKRSQFEDKPDEIKYEHIYLITAEDKKLENRSVRVPLSLTSQVLLAIILKQNKEECPFSDFTSDDFRRWLVKLFNDKKMSYSKLIQIARICNSEKIPPVISTVFSKSINYYSVKQSRFEHMNWAEYRKKRVSMNEVPEDEPEETKFAPPAKQSMSNQYVKAMKEVQKILNPKKRKQEIKKDLKGFIEENEELLAGNETFSLLVEYVMDMLNSIKVPSTIYTYYIKFSVLLMEVCGETPLSEYDFDELYSLFVDIVQVDRDVRKHSGGNMTRKVKAFLAWYLPKRTGDKSIINEFLKSPELEGTSSNVKPLLITPLELDMFLEEIKKHETSEAYDIIELLCILGFYCGLRRFEIEKLHLHSFNFDIEAIIRVAKSKTAAGRRNVPIEHMVPEHHREIIKNYWNKRLGEKKGKLNYKLITQDLSPYIQNIATLLKKMFNEKTLSFHSLRHCCCSWLATELMLIYYPGAKKYLPAGFRSLHVPQSDLGRFQKLIGTGYRRSTLFHNLAKFMGHAGPETTIERYIHTLDFFAEYFIREADNGRQYMTSKQICNLIQGVNDNTLHRETFTQKPHGMRLKKNVIELISKL